MHRDRCHVVLARQHKGQLPVGHQRQLAALGVVDRVVAEKPDAAAEPEKFCLRVGAVLAAELAGLLTRGPGAPADRAARYLGG